jgi:hypothetical protein
MVFGKKTKNIDNTITTTIEGTMLGVVTQTKFLGIILDNGLTWKYHTLYISKKLSKSLGILSRARQLLNKSTLRQLYYSFLYPYLSYCNIIWGHSSDNILWPIFRIQKRAIRVIENIRHRDSTKSAFQSLKFLRLPDIYKFSVLIFVYKFKNGLLPQIFNSFYTENSQIHGYATRNARQFRIPLTKTKISASFLKKTGVTIWNAFDDQITHTVKIGLFKRQITSLLISKYSP